MMSSMELRIFSVLETAVATSTAGARYYLSRARSRTMTSGGRHTRCVKDMDTVCAMHMEVQ